MDDTIIVAIISVVGSVTVALITSGIPKKPSLKSLTTIEVPRNAYNQLIAENLALKEEIKQLKKELEK